MALLHWPGPRCDQRNLSFCDNVHGSTTVFYPLSCIIDTKEFQRLRELKQSGLSHLVYPTATHNRFVHCVGTYWLAYRLVDSIRAGNPALGITSADHLCVAIAALCHGLGWGPFGYAYEGLFQEEMAKEGKRMPTNEEMSCALIRRIFKKEHVVKTLEPYLGCGEEFERNLDFITELVDSKKFDSDGNWLPKGRSIEKSFLYHVVANDNDSIDVDKWDYLVRDSVNTGVPIGFNINSAERLIKNAWVLRDPDRGFLRICYPQKAADTLVHIGHARHRMHETIYQHKICRAVEIMVIRALKLAGPYLKFEGDDGHLYPLNRVTENLGAFLKTNDGILSLIVNSHGREFEAAKRIIEAMEVKEFPQRLEEEPYSPAKADSLYGNNTANVSIRYVENMVKFKMMNHLGGTSISSRDFILMTRVIHRGMGRVDPMERVLLFDTNYKIQPHCANRDWVRLKASESSELWGLGVYVPHGIPAREASLIQSAFDRTLVEIQLRSDS